MPFLDFLSPVTKVVETVVDRLVPDNAASKRIKDEIAKELALAQIHGQLAQIEVNKAEAQNPSLFVAGWRPGVGWICALALGYQFVLAPIGTWLAAIVGHPLPTPPMLDEALWQLILGMLGMGGLRTFEKIKGVAAK